MRVFSKEIRKVSADTNNEPKECLEHWEKTLYPFAANQSREPTDVGHIHCEAARRRLTDTSTGHEAARSSCSFWPSIKLHPGGASRTTNTGIQRLVMLFS